MRILLTVNPGILVPPALYGGIERIVEGLVINLQRRGHRVALVATNGSTCPVDRFFPWPGKTPLGRFDSIINSLAVMRACLRFRPDIVHCFSRAALLAPILKLRTPKIISLQLPPQQKTGRLIARWGRNTVFTGCSEHICASGRKGGGEWVAIHNFVDLEKFSFQKAVAPDAPLVFLSRIEAQKGAHLAIETAKCSGRRLLIAGNHSPTPEAKVFWHEKMFPEIGRNGIEYVGPVNDAQKNDLLGKAAAMVVPVQWDEPFGIVFAEALACGTPVISCPRGALPEIVRDGVDGFLVNSVGEACAAVEKLSTINRTDCRRHAEECFSSQVITNRYERLYRLMAQEKMKNA
jgi:glycosyltransferase involved in cell wall biosynthesis